MTTLSPASIDNEKKAKKKIKRFSLSSFFFSFFFFLKLLPTSTSTRPSHDARRRTGRRRRFVKFAVSPYSNVILAIFSPFSFQGHPIVGLMKRVYESCACSSDPFRNAKCRQVAEDCIILGSTMVFFSSNSILLVACFLL